MEKDPNSLTQLMEKDPLGLTDPELDVIIAGMREMRDKFNLGDMKAGTVKKAVPKALQGLDVALESKLDIKL